MGYMRHEAIVVTSWKKSYLEVARNKALEFGLDVTELTNECMNGYVSFLIAPDGSKEGWEESDAHETKRGEWVSWAKTCDKNNIYFD